MARRLTDIDLEEVSLVGEGAVKRKFLIIKRQNKEVNMDDELTLEDVENAEVEKKLSDKAVNAIKGALKILKAYEDEFKGKLKDAVDAMVDAVKVYGYPEGSKAEGEYAKPEKEKTEKGGARFSKETKEKLHAIAKDILSLIEEEVEEATEVKKSEPDTEEILSYVKTKVKELVK